MVSHSHMVVVTFLLTVIAWDADSGDSGSVIFSVEGSDDFSILTTSQQLEGQLVYLGTLLVQRLNHKPTHAISRFHVAHTRVECECMQFPPPFLRLT